MSPTSASRWDVQHLVADLNDTCCLTLAIWDTPSTLEQTSLLTLVCRAFDCPSYLILVLTALIPSYRSGFVQQFGTVRDPRTQALALDATHVSIWGGLNFAAQLVFQMASPLTADRFGVRTNLYILTAAMLVVRGVQPQ